MDKESNKLKLKGGGNLSTVHEGLATLTNENSNNFKTLTKDKLLEKYKESDDLDFNFEHENDFNLDLLKRKIEDKKSKTKGDDATPFKNDSKEYPDSIPSSLSSSRTPSNISKYSESETENSDYADEFDDLENLNDMDVALKLLQNFQKRQKRAVLLAEMNKNRIKNNDKFNSKEFLNLDSNFQNLEIQDFSNEFNDDELNSIDFKKFKKFKNRSTSSLINKHSMPSMKKITSLNGSPKKIKKFSSTMDFNTIAKIPNNLNDPFESIDDYDLTITLSDYEKLKRKSQKFDYSKYVEQPSVREKHRKQRHNRYIDEMDSYKDEENDYFNQGNHRHHHQYKQNKNQDYDQRYTQNTPLPNTYTSKLLKQGKIKLIRSLGTPRPQKLPGHLYGEVKYDPQRKKWFGNEEELLIFEKVKPYSKPKLIKKKDYNQQVVGDMVYDNKKLRWVSLNGEYEDDPFDDDFDNTVILNENSNFRSRSESAQQKRPSLLKNYRNGKNNSKGRLVPSESILSLSDNLNKHNNNFKVTPEMYKSWKTEEERWIRKVVNWFPHDDNNHQFKYDLKIFLNKQ